MDALLPFLKSLLEVSGLSAYEQPAARLIEAKWRPLADEVHFSHLGSLHALKRGRGPEPRPSLLVAAHMDSIGLIVTGLQDGLLQLAAVGGVDPAILPGAVVRVHTAGGDLPGIISAAAREDRNRAPAFVDLRLDTGLSAAQTRRRIKVGDLVSFDNPPTELPGGLITGHSLDNRASVAAVTYALRELDSRAHHWDVWVAATAQEETTTAGAATSAFQLRPNMAVIVDVTFAEGPGVPSWSGFKPGEGPTLGVGPVIHPGLHRRFREAAERLGWTLPVEPMPDYSLTDADVVQVTAEGIPCMVLGIPIRYMHTPVEIAAIKDIERTGRLLTEFIATLEGDFLQKAAWE